MILVITTVSAMPFSHVPGDNDLRTTDREGSANLIAAARSTGVSHFVYTSFSRNIDDPFPLRNARCAVEVTHVPVDALEAQHAAASDPMQQSFAGLMQCVAHGDPIDMSGTLQAIPVRLSSVAEYAERVLGAVPAHV